MEGYTIKPELTFERQANAEDIKRKQMNILVYESKNINNNDISKKGLEEKEIDNLKEKINFILSKYLADRKYLENKVDNWRDAILKGCEKLFSKYTDYKIFINIIIRDKQIKGYQNKLTSGYYGVNNYFKVKFDLNNIKCSIYIIFFKKIKRVPMDFNL